MRRMKAMKAYEGKRLKPFEEHTPCSRVRARLASSTERVWLSF